MLGMIYFIDQGNYFLFDGYENMGRRDSSWEYLIGRR
jgi:hypothetical protein